jgi:hypothetical protein
VSFQNIEKYLIRVLKNKYRVILVIIGLILIGAIVFRSSLMGYHYDFMEFWTLRDKVTWSANKKLTWNDFNKKEEGLSTKVVLSARYNVDDPILFRSKTIFIPYESYASDTTDLTNLRIAQTKFNLLEVYRRKMENEVDSLRQVKSLKEKPSDFQKMNKRYYDLFDLEWEKHLNQKNKMESLKNLEIRISETLK